MKADPKGVLTGSHYMDGDQACAEGALAAGCRFIAGYPITPSTEVAERFARRIPQIGGVFIQMEDEIASMAAVLGAVWGGTKAMTVTSGPGYSLMMEHIGYAAMTETPLVVVNVQRAGPSTGLPTMPAQADMLQARWGSHGDYRVIALCPNSPQECFDLAIKAFNLAETWRVPVLIMMDEVVAHMSERVVIPTLSEIAVVQRRYTQVRPGEYQPYRPAARGVPEMAPVGKGFFMHVTGLTHDAKGYPAMDPETQDALVRRFTAKIDSNADDIIVYEEEEIADAEVVVVAYGITSRAAAAAVEEARALGIPAGLLRLVTAWPFPEKKVRELSGRVKALIMVELNLGQMFLEMDRCAKGGAQSIFLGHAGGSIHRPEAILMAIQKAAQL